jgi:hypothetical protein
MPIFLSACGVITLAGASWITLECWRETVKLLADKKLTAKQIASDAAAYGMFGAFAVSGFISGAHSLAAVWLP